MCPKYGSRLCIGMSSPFYNFLLWLSFPWLLSSLSLHTCMYLNWFPTATTILYRELGGRESLVDRRLGASDDSPEHSSDLPETLTGRSLAGGFTAGVPLARQDPLIRLTKKPWARTRL